VFVGVLGAVSVMTNRAAPVLEATARVAPAANALKPAVLVLPKVPALEPARTRDEPAKAKAETVASSEAPKSALESKAPPVSGSTVPSCRELLGKSLAVRHDPKRALRETRVGNRALVRGNVVEAQAAFCKALFWDRSNIDRHINLGRLFLVRRDWAKAAEYGQSALELDPESRPALGLVGDAWAALNKTKEARTAWLLAERKPKANASELRLIVRRNMALAKRVERLQDFSLAERFYRRTLLLEPEHTGAMKGLASCLLRFGDKRAAESWARRADARKG
jgi:tetratricopeptide (TPR) repeat protein